MMDSQFRKVLPEDLSIIMHWRMSPEITEFMCTDPQLTMEDQEAWYERIKREKDTFYWIYEYHGKPAGLVSLIDWDKKNGIIHSGAYIAEHEARGLQNIIDMNMNLNAFAFESLKVHKLAIEIMSNNVGQLHWALRFGFSKEGVLRDAIIKKEKRYDLHLFSILEDEWTKIAGKIKFNRIYVET